MAPSGPLTEEHIAKMVAVFYQRARAHPSLGRVFNTVVADWDHHLAVVQDFWSRALLATNRYSKHPYPAHVDLPIKREHFAQWLELFRPAALENLPQEDAYTAIAKAEQIAESFRRGLFPFDPIN
ncbi:MAG TPA: group III truncated hemoglobin [Marinagarivorans sp.]|nr:group III truncated hemoglobin [Cellvibrionaceae bacterium]HMY40890.1 group III truncated hemoglobin [Marinagarivorans sp.]